MEGGDVLDDVDVLDGGQLDGGEDGEQDAWIWQPLANRRNIHRVHYVDYGENDVSKIFKTGGESDSMILYSFHDDNTPGMRLVARIPDPEALSEVTAHEDLACLSANISCEGDADRLVLLYRKPGEACHPLIEKLPNDYFVDEWLKLGDTCVATGLVGEEKVGNGFYFPFDVAFSPDSMQAYAVTWGVNVSGDDPMFNLEYAEAAFSEPVSEIRLVPSASRRLEADSAAHGLVVQAFKPGGGFSQIEAGGHRVQADCGGGFEDVRLLNEIGRYRDETLEFPEAVDEHEDDMVQFENCAVRVGYRP